jgi:hypothetical protein
VSEKPSERWLFIEVFWLEKSCCQRFGGTCSFHLSIEIGFVRTRLPCRPLGRLALTEFLPSLLSPSRGWWTAFLATCLYRLTTTSLYRLWSWRWWQHISPKHWYQRTTLPGVKPSTPGYNSIPLEVQAIREERTYYNVPKWLLDADRKGIQCKRGEKNGQGRRNALQINIC